MKKAPRVLVLVDWVPQSDSVLIQALQKAGLDCDALGIDFHQSKWTPFMKIFSYWPRCLWVSIRAFRRRRNYDYMLAWSQTMGTLLGLIKLFTGANLPRIFILEAVIVERGNPLLERIRRLFIAASWKKIEHIGFMSKAYQRLIQERYKVSDSQCVHLKSPLIKEKEQCYSGFKVDGYIYSAGRSFRDYGTLFAAARKSPFRFVVGTSDDAIQGMTIPENVIVHRGAFGPEADRLLREASAVVIPLEKTTAPAGDLTLTEAMYCGKPVIITETLITSEYIEHGENGFLVPRKDPDAIVEAVNAIFSDPEKSDAMGRMARKTVMENHTFDVFGRRVAEAIMNDVSGEKAS